MTVAVTVLAGRVVVTVSVFLPPSSAAAFTAPAARSKAVMLLRTAMTIIETERSTTGEKRGLGDGKETGDERRGVAAF